MSGAPRRLRIRGVLAMLTASLLIRGGQLQVTVHVIGEVTAVLGRDVNLTCSVETKEKVSQLTWQKKMDPNNRNLLTYRKGQDRPSYLTPAGEEKILVLGIGTNDIGDILIRDVQLSDEGTYVCSFSTHPSGIREKEIKLQVHVPPTVSLYLPQISAQTSPRNVAQCTAAAAKPPAQITWVSSTLPYSTNFTDIVHENKTVTRTSQLWMVPTKSLSGQDATCLVSQEEFQQEVKVTLDNILYAPQDVTITTHKSREGILQLRCTASANPPANYTWRRENVNLPGGVTLQLTDVLMVPNTDTDVLHQYTCETNNRVGSERGFIYIYAIDPGCRCYYGVAVGVVLAVLALCVGVLCWTKGIIRKGRCLGRKNSEKHLEVKEENEYVDDPLEAEESKGQWQDRKNRETEERSPEASAKSIALVTSGEKTQSHLDPSKDLKEAEDT